MSVKQSKCGKCHPEKAGYPMMLCQKHMIEAYPKVSQNFTDDVITKNASFSVQTAINKILSLRWLLNALKMKG